MFDSRSSGGGLQVIRDTGRPHAARWRHVLPPQRVSVDLGALFTLPPHHAAHPVPDGLALRGVVPARLSAWARSAQGDWFALVAYDAAAADGSSRAAVSHWVPAHVVRPVDGVRDPAR